MKFEVLPPTEQLSPAPTRRGTVIEIQDRMRVRDHLEPLPRAQSVEIIDFTAYRLLRAQRSARPLA